MRLVQVAAAAAAALITAQQPAFGDAAPAAGSVIFEAKCAACHGGGGNVLNPTKTLFTPALKANGYSEVEPVVTLLRNGKGQMPKYQGQIPPISRLTDEELENVAQFVLEQAGNDWK